MDILLKSGVIVISVDECTADIRIDGETIIIKENKFVFEDLLKLHARYLQRLWRETDQNDLALILQGSGREVEEAILSNVSKRTAAVLQEDVRSLGSIPPAAVNYAKDRIVKTALRLDDQLEILIRPRRATIIT